MYQSAFIDWINKYFPGIVSRVITDINGQQNPLPYLFRRMLTPTYSVTGKWDSLSAAFTLVAADVVSMDSQLPIKKRDAMSKATGDIPKIGMKMWLNETQLTQLDLIQAAGGPQATPQIISQIFADTPKCIGGVYERLEGMFLEGLSTGVTVVDDSNNVGTGIRLDYGYKTANKFGVFVLWSTPATSTPITDFQRVVDKATADGVRISRVMMDRTAFNTMVQSTQFKQSLAFSLGINSDGTAVPRASLDQANNFIGGQFGFTIEIVDRSIRTEKNGTVTTEKPWQDGAVVFLTSDNVGGLFYATLAEQNHPSPMVSYQTADSFILVSKYRKIEPISEHTSSQARAVPVISNVDQIYTMDTKTVQA